MEISSTQAAQSPTNTAAPTSTAAVISSDFETFLQMLTAQARYQDPLEPVDSSEYAAQLAQFSMVEQQVLSNDLLTALGAQIGSGNIAQMAGWIGMEARTTAPVQFSGTPLTVVPEPLPGSDEAILIAYDSEGVEVQRQQIPVNGEALEWAGVAEDGSPFDTGVYRFSVESRTAGEVTGITPAGTYARITEARREGDTTFLILEGGSPVTSAEVAALREPYNNISQN